MFVMQMWPFQTVLIINCFLFLYPLQDWDYLLVSNYHRRVNSQPVSGPVDSSVSSNARRTDTNELSSVSNWLSWFRCGNTRFPNFVLSYVLKYFSFLLVLGVWCKLLETWLQATIVLYCFQQPKRVWESKNNTKIRKIHSGYSLFRRCLLLLVHLWSWTLQLRSFLTFRPFSTSFTCSIRNCNWMSCREKLLHPWFACYSSWPGNIFVASFSVLFCWLALQRRGMYRSHYIVSTWWLLL